MIIRCKFEKKGDIAFISHRDLVNIMSRSLRRAGIDIKYSEGFNPHAKTAFSPALSLGIESRAEYMDVEMEEDSSLSCEEFIERLNGNVPVGIRIVKAVKLEKSDSLSSLITHGEYRIEFVEEGGRKEEIDQAIHKINTSEYLPAMKRNKKGEWREVDVRDMIRKVDCNREGNLCVVYAILQNSPQGALKPDDFMKILSRLLEREIEDYHVWKLKSLSENGKEMHELDEMWRL